MHSTKFTKILFFCTTSSMNPEMTVSTFNFFSLSLIVSSSPKQTFEQDNAMSDVAWKHAQENSYSVP